MTKTIKELGGKTWPPRSLWMPLPQLRKQEEELTHGFPGREEIPPHRGGPAVRVAPTIGEEMVWTARPRLSRRGGSRRPQAEGGSVQSRLSLERARTQISIT